MIVKVFCDCGFMFFRIAEVSDIVICPKCHKQFSVISITRRGNAITTNNYGVLFIDSTNIHRLAP